MPKPDGLGLFCAVFASSFIPCGTGVAGSGRPSVCSTRGTMRQLWWHSGDLSIHPTVPKLLRSLRAVLLLGEASILRVSEVGLPGWVWMAQQRGQGCSVSCR